jgi:hypothetical protein
VASKSSKRRRKRRRAAAGGRAAADDAAIPSEPSAGQAAAATATAPRRPRKHSADDEPPPAPWGSFPLIELTVLVGIVMLILGFAVFEGERRTILIGTGLLLGSIGGLDLSIREHLAGYRSHTMVLAGVPSLAVLALLFFAGPESLPPIARAAIALAVFGLAAYWLTRVFRNRSGGQSFKLSGLTRR